MILSAKLGVMEFDDNTRCTIADIPGLFEGAHHGAGLGARFLRHIERTKLLVHLVAPADEEPRADFEHMHYAYELVRNELRQYSGLLPVKPEIVCLTKTDLLDPAEVEELLTRFRAAGIDAVALSASDGEGLDAFRERLRGELSAFIADREGPEDDNDGPAPEPPM